MSQPLHDRHSQFEISTWPSTDVLGRSLEGDSRVAGVLLELRFGSQVAKLRVADLWSACCELLLQAQLVREAKLDRFVIDVEQIFDITYDGDVISCVFSREHVFTVSRAQFAASIERMIETIFDATSCPRLMQVAASWGASSIRGLPYAFRFSESVLT